MKTGGIRDWVGRGYTLVEDLVYVALGLLLSGIALLLVVGMFIDFSRGLPSWSTAPLTSLLDHILLVLLVVELLYTVQVSFKAHQLQAEPFLLVGLISAIRRVLLLTAEMGEQKQGIPHTLLVELAVLALLILVLTGALITVRKTRASESDRR